MARRYFVERLPPPGPCRLPAETAHHLRRVMRARAGDEVVLFDGAGGECDARLVRLGAAGLEAEAGPARAVQRGPRRRLELAFACPKGPRAEWLFEHATELGVAVLRPLRTARGEALGSGARRDRWLRIVRAAAGQCDRSHLPEVFDPEPLEALLARAELPAERWLAEPGAPPLRPALDDAILLVGPPGGLTADERAAACAAGFAAASLGPLTLRTETAALAGAAVLLAG